jgi:enoyl-[acyl-carrier-protein] reductase (NADH)
LTGSTSGARRRVRAARGAIVTLRRDLARGLPDCPDISAYSLIALARRRPAARAPGRGSILTLTYLGSQRVFLNYNVMG